MNVEIGTEAAQFPEKEYINGIFLAVRVASDYLHRCRVFALVRIKKLREKGSKTLYASIFLLLQYVSCFASKRERNINRCDDDEIMLYR